jgi:hypothetical protein
VLASAHQRRARREIVNILTVNLLLSTLVFWVAARIYVLPKLTEFGPRAVLLPILLLHSLRHLGLDVPCAGRRLFRHAVAIRLPGRIRRPARRRARDAAIPAVAMNARAAKPLVWLFNVEGTVDLIDAIVLAQMYNAAPHMGPAYWIPAFWVPALLVTHYVTFVVLWSDWKRAN